MERPICTKCSTCRERAVQLATIEYDIQVDHDGRKYQVHVSDLNTPRCSNCGQIYFDDFSSEQISQALRRKVGLLQPTEIRQAREKLELTPQQVADLLDVSAQTYSGWESGEVIQMRSQDRFLRLFFQMPEVRKTLADRQAIDLAPVNS